VDGCARRVGLRLSARWSAAPWSSDTWRPSREGSTGSEAG
jgi:hypothetical protein